MKKILRWIWRLVISKKDFKQIQAIVISGNTVKVPLSEGVLNIAKTFKIKQKYVEGMSLYHIINQTGGNITKVEKVTLIDILSDGNLYINNILNIKKVVSSIDLIFYKTGTHLTGFIDSNNNFISLKINK